MARPELLTLIRTAADSGTPDAVLLGRFLDAGDDSAFAELVRRYARLVWGQCCNLLPTEADADDSFQATFLTLATSARTVRDTNKLGPWLHGVAYRVCLNARRAAARRTKRERTSAVAEAVRPVADSAWDAAATAVYEEVSKLPESLRVPFVLCWLEGKAPTDAAEQLGLPWGTFSSRLSRAKQRLMERLSVRGIGAAVAVGVVGGGLLAAAAAVERAVQLGSNPASAPASVVSLTAGVRAMSRVKLLAVVLVATVGVGMLFLPGGNPVTAPAHAAPVPKDEEARKKAAEEAWADLASDDDLVASRALLRLRDTANEKFFADKLKPLTLTEVRAKELLATLGSDDEKAWKAAYEELSYLDPRLAVGLQDLTKMMWSSQVLDERLAALFWGKLPADADACRWCKTQWTFYKLPGKDGTSAATMMLKNHPDKPADFETRLDKEKQPGIGIAVGADAKSLNAYKTNAAWRRAARATALLEHLDTPAAKKVLDDMATGHADAGPTKAAKAALERLKK